MIDGLALRVFQSQKCAEQVTHPILLHHMDDVLLVHQALPGQFELPIPVYSATAKVGFAEAALQTTAHSSQEPLELKGEEAGVKILLLFNAGFKDFFGGLGVLVEILLT